MAKGLQLGRYHLLDRIAFGGMAEIYRAKTFDEEGRVHMVAVKRILSHLARDEEFIKMLVDEAKIASLMEHESIARVYEFCHAHGEYFIAMEYVDGKDGRTILDRCRAQRRWIPPEICAFVMMHIMRGLHQAHRQTDPHGRALHLVHRDVSPSNVICSYAGEVKLCDFGIAKATLSTVQTRSGVIKGKVKYMSPEQAMGRKLDPRTDIFSGGSVLYELLTRVPPFLAPNEMELLVLVREARYTPVRERNPMIPPALEAIVDTAMSRRPSDRYQTAEDFANALHNFLVVHAPDLTRSHLGRFVRQLFSEDIEKELRALEEYVVESADNEEVGVNLIADALGPDADFSMFSPVPTSAVDAEEVLQPQDGEVEAGNEGGPKVADPALSAEPTVILENGDLASLPTVSSAQRVESTDPEHISPEAEVLWRQGEDVSLVTAPPRSSRTDKVLPGVPATAETPSTIPGLHTAQTVILQLSEQETAASESPEIAPEQGQPRDPSLRPDTEETLALGAPRADLEPDHLGESSPGDTPMSSMILHDAPTDELDSPVPLSEAETSELELSGAEELPEDLRPPPAEQEPRAPGAFARVIHTEETQILELEEPVPDDMEPSEPAPDGLET